MLVINLYAGPGAGKSTIASDTFALLKWKNVNVELVSEYAKAVTWEGRHTILQDQLYILAKQNRMLERLRTQVDYAITDSPLFLNRVYSGDYYPSTFGPFVNDLYNSYDNLNIFLEREKPYHKVGRNQTEDEARELDKKIKDLLIQSGQEFKLIKADDQAKFRILELLDLV